MQLGPLGADELGERRQRLLVLGRQRAQAALEQDEVVLAAEPVGQVVERRDLGAHELGPGVAEQPLVVPAVLDALAPVVAGDGVVAALRVLAGLAPAAVRAPQAGAQVLAAHRVVTEPVGQVVAEAGELARDGHRLLLARRRDRPLGRLLQRLAHERPRRLVDHLGLAPEELVDGLPRHVVVAEGRQAPPGVAQRTEIRAALGGRQRGAHEPQHGAGLL